MIDIMIIGAGPVGLMSAYLATLSGLKVKIIDKSEGPIKFGRADALNARTLQLLEIVGLFSKLYPLGKTCNTSSVFKEGKFISRESSWWESLEGTFHKHFLMLGQAHLEKLLIEELSLLGVSVQRKTTASDVFLSENSCHTTLDTGEKVSSKYLIGADGPRSFIREKFKIAFDIIRPRLTWAVIDGVIESNFPKVPEIIVFQNETSDVAWIPREKDLDRFYIRMDQDEFSQDDVLSKINTALKPYTLRFKEVEWFSKFSVKESVAEKFSVEEKVFLVGDACHIHSVNGGQGLNTGLMDAFNLIWKMNMVNSHDFSSSFLKSYQEERLPVAKSVIETSGELVRSTKYSHSNTHAEDYVNIVKKRSANITGMGIRYGDDEFKGSRVFDFEILNNKVPTRLYSLLDYSKYTLLIVGDSNKCLELPSFIRSLFVSTKSINETYYSHRSLYEGMAILIRPDTYIEKAVPLDEIKEIFTKEPYFSTHF